MSHVPPKITIKDLENFSTVLELRENPVYAANLVLSREYDPQQALAVWGMWTHPYSMLDWGRGVGKSVSIKTTLLTNHGFKTFEDLMPKHLRNVDKLTVTPATDNIHVHTPEGMRKVKNWMSCEKTKTLKFTSSRGLSITLCETNPTLTIKNGQVGWESSGDLKVGDNLALNRRNESWDYEPNALDPELARLMGYLVGDGTVNADNRFGLTNMDEYIKNDFANIILKHYNKVVLGHDSILKGKNADLRYLKVNCSDAREHLHDLGLAYAKAKDKTVPHSVWGASRLAQREFLRGLYDTDGTSDKRGCISFCTISKQLAEGVQLLLLSFGITSRLREKQGKYKNDLGDTVECNMAYMVEITNVKDSNLFYDRIGFGLERKQSRRSLLADKVNTNNDTIPGLGGQGSVFEALMAADTRKGARSSFNKKWLALKGTLKGKYECTYEKLPRIIEYFSGVDHPGVDYLKSLIEWDFFFDPIVSIEEGEDYMYDLEVEPEEGDKLEHAFIANGFVIHNCVTGDSLITMADGSHSKIEDLYNKQKHSVSYMKKEWWAILDEPMAVKSYNKKENKFTNGQVQSILRQKIEEDLYRITLRNGSEVTSTKIHKFYVEKEDGYEWVEAQDIAHGDTVMTLNKRSGVSRSKVVEVEVIPTCEEYRYVYDLSVVSLKNYVANGITTHNTTMAADVEVLSALLYPGTTSMVVSHSMKGAKLVFDELIKTWMRSPIVRDSTPKRPSKGNDLCEMPFNSINEWTGQQTIIKGIAADINNDGASIRGNRVSRCLHIDEWIFLPQDLINGAVMPCASTTDDPTRPQYDLNLTRFMFTCSSGYTYMEAYKRMETFRKFFMHPEKYPEYALDRDGKPQYFYHNLNYEKVTKKGILNTENIKMWKATFPVAKFNTEVLAKWESESGSWYNAASIKGNPEKGDRGIWVKSESNVDAAYVDKDKTGDYKYVLAVDPAERQDESGVALIRVTPNNLYIADTNGFKYTSQEEVAEIIRTYVDKYDVDVVVLDPGGGGTGVGNYLKNTKIRQNTLTGKLEPFFPIFPIDDKWLNKKGESIPAGARRMLEYITFSSTSGLANLTDLNITLRTLIESKSLLVAEDGPEEFTERVNTLMDQIIAIEAEAIASKVKNRESARQAADKGRYSFTSRVLKDRWAALLIGVHQAMIVQAEMNMAEEEEDPGIYIMPSIYDIYGGNYF